MGEFARGTDGDGETSCLDGLLCGSGTFEDLVEPCFGEGFGDDDDGVTIAAAALLLRSFLEGKLLYVSGLRTSVFL